MKLLESITITSPSGEIKNIDLYLGDLVSPLNSEKFDLLVTSAFPGNYVPVPGTLIGALDEIGISLNNLTISKKYDLREYFSCWMMNVPPDVEQGKKVCFNKILCYESKQKGEAWEFIGGVFQAIMPFIFEPPGIKTIAMPVLSSGNQGYNHIKMLDAILQSACNWLKNGMPIEKIMIVEKKPEKAYLLKDYFKSFKNEHNYTSKKESVHFLYDFFISYSRQDESDINYFIKILKEKNPETRLFFDRFEINAGSSWYQKIHDALDNSNKVITFLSPQYLKSEICKEEYNTAHIRNLEEGEDILQPILLYSTKLPTYMKLIHYFDCTEADKHKLLKACNQIVSS